MSSKECTVRLQSADVPVTHQDHPTLILGGADEQLDCQQRTETEVGLDAHNLDVTLANGVHQTSQDKKEALNLQQNGVMQSEHHPRLSTGDVDSATGTANSRLPTDPVASADPLQEQPRMEVAAADELLSPSPLLQTPQGIEFRSVSKVINTKFNTN